MPTTKYSTPLNDARRQPLIDAVSNGIISHAELEVIKKRWEADDINELCTEWERLFTIINESGFYKIEATRTRLK